MELYHIQSIYLCVYAELWVYVENFNKGHWIILNLINQPESLHLVDSAKRLQIPIIIIIYYTCNGWKYILILIHPLINKYYQVIVFLITPKVRENSRILSFSNIDTKRTLFLTASGMLYFRRDSRDPWRRRYAQNSPLISGSTLPAGFSLSLVPLGRKYI